MELTTKNLTLISVIAAVYTVINLIFANISYASIQFRISEVLMVLTIFSFISIYGVTLGCFTSNLIGLFLGVEGTSIPDLFIGTFATLVSAFFCYYMGKSKNKILIYLFAMLPTVLINGFMVGLELTFINRLGKSFIINFLTVALGEFVVCYGLGLFLIHILLKNDLYKKLF